MYSAARTLGRRKRRNSTRRNIRNYLSVDFPLLHRRAHPLQAEIVLGQGKRLRVYTIVCRLVLRRGQKFKGSKENIIRRDSLIEVKPLSKSRLRENAAGGHETWALGKLNVFTVGVIYKLLELSRFCLKD